MFSARKDASLGYAFSKEGGILGLCFLQGRKHPWAVLSARREPSLGCVLRSTIGLEDREPTHVGDTLGQET